MINRDWHANHRMPDNATEQQRVDWHLEHAEQCGCREIPDSIQQAMTRRGIAVPLRRGD